MFFAASLLSFLPILALRAGIERWSGDRKRARREALWPAVAVQGLLVGLFVFHLVPPVPLSVRFLGVYHGVEREGGEFKLSRLPRPVWERPWRKDEPVFMARPGDRVWVFTRIFAPHNFRDQVRVRWARWDSPHRRWEQSDAIPMHIVGGREEGFGGYAYKQNWLPGEWLVGVETDDGREIGRTRFEVRPDSETVERIFDVVRR
jgi:hypothetical protein